MSSWKLKRQEDLQEGEKWDPTATQGPLILKETVNIGNTEQMSIKNERMSLQKSTLASTKSTHTLPSQRSMIAIICLFLKYKNNNYPENFLLLLKSALKSGIKYIDPG